MQKAGWIRGAATTVCALGLIAGPVATAYAAPTPTAPSGTRTPAQVRATPAPAGTTCGPDKLTVLNINDFHGRLATSRPDTVGFFGDLEKLRADAGGDSRALVYANGDSIGGSLFASASQQDNPTIDILNAAAIDGHSTGNHEFDKGAKDFVERVVPGATFPYQSANVINESTGKPIAEAYRIYDKAGLKVAVVGAVTGDLPSLVSPTGLAGYKVTDPVDAVNAEVAKLKDGDPTNGEADIVIAAYHEGASGSSTDPKVAPAGNPAFDKIVNRTDSRVNAILNAHSHMNYAYQAPVPGMTGATRPVIQSGSYASHIGKVELGFDPTSKQVTCYTAANVPSTMASSAAVAAYPRAAAIKPILDKALADAKVVGAQVVGSATAPITRAQAGERTRESALTDAVAQMFRDQLSGGNADFIGLQNPGGTRADLDAGDITYEEAAGVLPFANSLMTTEITGAQLKAVLEQQWQPGDKYLQLGVSPNLTYTYDPAAAAGSRITSIALNGKPVNPSTKYTVGSGSFLISGGDNFSELTKGTNTRDTGRVDLEAFVDWVKAKKTLSPDFARQAVSMTPKAGGMEAGKPVTFTLGKPSALAPDTLDMTASGSTPPPNTEVIATVNGKGVGRAPVANGQSTLTVNLPADVPAGPAVLKIEAKPSGTTSYVPITVAGPLGQPVSTQFCGLRDGGCGQHFERGSVYDSASTNPQIIKGAIREKWAQLGWENGQLGYPTSDENCGLKDGGCFQSFQGGLIYWSPATGAHPVWGEIYKAYAAQGWERGTLGYPTSDENCGLKDKGCVQGFQGGVILWSPATGAHPVWGAIVYKYAEKGWETGQLGYPIGNEFCGLRDGGCAQFFQGGSIYWSPASGAHPSWGLIRDHWARNGWEAGRFGYPVWDEQCSPVGGDFECRQSYQGGVIVWNNRTGMSG
ncbi:hypothetical protein HJ590_13785 [Naumannella sp. ID2617S]|nr:hypothetical protein [Naumannella sp. ID2617S]